MLSQIRRPLAKPGGVRDHMSNDPPTPCEARWRVRAHVAHHGHVVTCLAPPCPARCEILSLSFRFKTDHSHPKLVAPLFWETHKSEPHYQRHQGTFLGALLLWETHKSEHTSPGHVLIPLLWETHKSQQTARRHVHDVAPLL